MGINVRDDILPSQCLLGLGGKLLDRRQPKGELRFVAVGEDAEGRTVGLDRSGVHHVWNQRNRRYEEAAGPVEIRGLTPSLLGHGIKGVLWMPDGTRAGED